MRKFKYSLVVLLFVLIIILSLTIYYGLSKQSIISVDATGHTEPTPIELQSVRNIGQWEFLTISDEEIVDTVRRSFFGDDELSRIYYGTLRLGSDLSKAKDNFIKVNNDTVVVTLPPITLLDHNFLDEARTRSLIEDGKWTENDRAALTKKAERMMQKRCLVSANMKKAMSNANIQVASLFHALGYKHVKVEIE